MKPLSFFLAIVLGCVACITVKKNTSTINSRDSDYISCFKMTYFKTLLNTAFNKTASIKEVLAMDHSNYSEMIILRDDFQFIDSIVQVDNQQMVRDSIESTVGRAEGSAGKRIFQYALDKYGSKWLDSVAHAREKVLNRALQDMGN